MDFLDTLVRYETALWNHLDQLLRATGSPSLGTVYSLRVVARYDGACRVQELRSDLAISVGAASKVVDRLERDGLAVRRANPADRRSSLVELTTAGGLELDRGVALVEDALAAHLDDEDLSTVTDTLVRLELRLQAGRSAVTS